MGCQFRVQIHYGQKHDTRMPLSDISWTTLLQVKCNKVIASIVKQTQTHLCSLRNLTYGEI